MNVTARQLKAALNCLTEEELDRKLVVDNGVFEAHDYKSERVVFSLFVTNPILENSVVLGLTKSKDHQPRILRWPKKG